MKNITDEYYEELHPLECSLVLLKENAEDYLPQFNDLVNSEDERLIKCIDKLHELLWNMRMGNIRILEMGKE